MHAYFSAYGVEPEQDVDGATTGQNENCRPADGIDDTGWRWNDSVNLTNVLNPGGPAFTKYCYEALATPGSGWSNRAGTTHKAYDERCGTRHIA